MRAIRSTYECETWYAVEESRFWSNVSINVKRRAPRTHNNPTVEILLDLLLPLACVNYEGAYYWLPDFGAILEI